ncbi:uncharacterized protein [Paramisgurnus dabryanus]|uniref:uncharacterized protein n=1 Tax=Paramisgurnus dabryanus TaxID=90735 RepID=UPI003CCF5B3A
MEDHKVKIYVSPHGADVLLRQALSLGNEDSTHMWGSKFGLGSAKRKLTFPLGLVAMTQEGSEGLLCVFPQLLSSREFWRGSGSTGAAVARSPVLADPSVVFEPGLPPRRLPISGADLEGSVVSDYQICRTHSALDIFIMLHFYTSEQMLKILLTVCLFGILSQPTDQVPVGGGFSFLLYPGSVHVPYKPQGGVIPMATFEQNTVQHHHNPQAQQSKISPHNEFKPLNTNGAFLQPAISSWPVQGPAPDLAADPAPDSPTFPTESFSLQGQMQMSNFLPFNFPMQVYSFLQPAVIADSSSSEEGQTAQVIYMIPVSVESSNMGVMEATVPDPGHLHVPTTTSAMVTTYPPAQGQLGETVVAVTGTESILCETRNTDRA